MHKIDRRKEVGKTGETMAKTWLLQHGYIIRHCNWSTRLGELDIVAQHRNQIVFVEVRTTQGKKYGFGFQSVNFRKQQKVRHLALQYLQKYGLNDQLVRFDVISVWLKPDPSPAEIRHIEGAF
jgi:putative endonuclease